MPRLRPRLRVRGVRLLLRRRGAALGGLRLLEILQRERLRLASELVDPAVPFTTKLRLLCRLDGLSLKGAA